MNELKKIKRTGMRIKLAACAGLIGLAAAYWAVSPDAEKHQDRDVEQTASIEQTVEQDETIESYGYNSAKTQTMKEWMKDSEIRALAGGEYRVKTELTDRALYKVTNAGWIKVCELTLFPLDKPYIIHAMDDVCDNNPEFVRLIPRENPEREVLLKEAELKEHNLWDSYTTALGTARTQATAQLKYLVK